jgi:Na+/H+ antiporter NhaD/arsenite permease-like protein
MQGGIMSAEIAAIAGLVIMFVIATALPINMGALAFVGAFAIGMIADMTAQQIFTGFPGDLFVTLVGITYLFGIAHNNGTVDWLVQKALWLVRGRIAAIPWVIFAIAAVLTSMGAVSPGAVAIIAPIALRFAHKYGISPLLMGLMVIHGAQGGGFSPISIYGSITNQVVERAGLPGSETAVFLASLAVNLCIAIAIYFYFGGHRAVRHAGQTAPDDPAAGKAQTGLDLHRSATLIGLIALGVGSLVYELNVGLVAISIAVLLALLAPNAQKSAVDQVSWSTVLLITGVITYIATSRFYRG